MAETPQFELLGQSLQQLTGLVEELGQPAYRGKQLFDALYRQRVSSWDEITTFPKSLREQLQERGYTIGLPKIAMQFSSVDGTIRYLMEFADGQSVETVWMPEGDNGEAGDGSDIGDADDVLAMWR